MPLTTPPETREPREAHRIDESALARWLDEHVEGCAGGTANVRQFAGGQSNPTYWVGVDGGRSGEPQELVIRKKPPGKLLPSAHAVEREYKVMRALDGTGVPVPKALGLCEDVGVIGTPFFVMRYVRGRVLWDPQLPGVPSKEERAAIHHDYIASLAKLHKVDYRAIGLGDFGKVGTYVQRQFDRWSKQYEASKTVEIPAMDALTSWFREHLPQNDETTLIHGDYRLDNMVFAKDEPRVLGIIDWELSTLGHPLSDLAYACLCYHVDNPGKGGFVNVDVKALGIPTENEQLDAYCAITGRSKIPDFSLFMAFSVFRTAAIVQGVYKRGLDGNASSEEARTFGERPKLLAEIGCQLAGIKTHS